MANNGSERWIPEKVDTWVEVFRDVMIVNVAAFMLIYETVFAHEVNAYLVGAGLTLAGVPPALRIDTRRRSRRVVPDPTNPPSR